MAGAAERAYSGDPRPYTAQLQELLGSHYDSASVEKLIKGMGGQSLPDIANSTTLLRTELSQATSEEAKEQVRTEWADRFRATAEDYK